MSKSSKPKRQVRLKIPSNLSATYANAVVISQTHSEIVMDFTQILPNDPRARVQTRVVMTPANAKAFLKALESNLSLFESRHGEITMPPKPTTLADELFGSIQSEDSEDSGEDGDE